VESALGQRQEGWKLAKAVFLHAGYAQGALIGGHFASKLHCGPQCSPDQYWEETTWVWKGLDITP